MVDVFDLESIAEALVRCSMTEKRCEVKNHPNAVRRSISQYRGVSEAHMYCPDCGLFYYRKLTPEEHKEWYGLLDSPMDL